MLIGIDASRAFLPERTGIEEYSYQVIKHLRDSLSEESVFLYIRPEQEVDFELPKNWQVKRLWAPRFWTQFRLSWEMLFHPVDVLFIPAHTVPLIHPRRTVVTIHGLEYEFCPQAYSLLDRWYMRLSIRYSVWVASTIIAVSENTKKDLISIYYVPEKKIQVVYEGYENSYQVSRIMYHVSDTQYKIPDTKYILFIGRLEERKNVVRIIEAFAILKEKYQIPHQLVLAGKPGYGYENIEYRILNIECRDEIMELGYVTEEEKWELFRGADVFLFPSLYEGFGIPVLEAQSVGTPVVTANTSSLQEVGGDGAVFVDPLSAESIADGVWKVLSDEGFRDGILERASRNVERFSWERCAEEVATTFSKRNERK
ncbi:MAG: glycosyltransferase family 1 protein [Candidatus Moraniibacteriota bacterium]